MADQRPRKKPLPLPPAVAGKLAAVGQQVEADSLKLEKEALDRVTAAYDGLYHVNPATGKASGALLAPIAQAQAAAALPSPNARLAAVPDILTAVDGAYSATVGAAMNSPTGKRRKLTEILADAVHLGVQGTIEALDVQAPAFGWDITPQRELTYLAGSQERFLAYWAKEPPRFRADVQAVLEDGLRRGLGPRQIGKLLAERAGVSRSRAALIAADQIGNARADAMQATQHELGVKRYQWSATGGKAGDGRTRDLHKHLHGGVYDWDKPGPAENGGHPGQPIRCRCVALPYVADLLADAPTIAELDEADRASLTSDPFTVWLDERDRLEAELADALADLKKQAPFTAGHDAAGDRWRAAQEALEAHRKLEPPDPLAVARLGRLAPGEMPAARLARLAAEVAEKTAAAQTKRAEGLALGQQLRQTAASVRAAITSPELESQARAWAAEQIPALEAEFKRLDAISDAAYDAWRLADRAYKADPSKANEKALEKADAARKEATRAAFKADKERARMQWAADGDAAYLGPIIGRQVKGQLTVKSSRIEITELVAVKDKPTARVPKDGRGPDALAQAALRVKEYADVDVKGRLEVRGFKGRAYHSRGRVFLDWNDADTVAIHEMGHWLEFNSPELADQAQKFLEYRAQGKKLSKMADKYKGWGFKQTEIYYAGAFDWSAGGRTLESLGDYCAKLYKNPQGEYYGTEITSIGLQLFEENPVFLAKVDPEFFDFIYTVARGGLWF